jgi:hypothetical protein
LAQSDVLAPAREGQLQCYVPNVEAKTCESLAGYSFDAQGGIVSQGEVLISPAQPLVVMSMSSPVTVRNGALCGPMTAEDLQRASFTIDGAPADAAQTQSIRAMLTQQLAGLLGVDVCTTFTPDSGGFRAEASFNGTPQPMLTQRVIWVGADEGYRVAP